jgi:hypothetical protein
MIRELYSATLNETYGYIKACAEFRGLEYISMIVCTRLYAGLPAAVKIKRPDHGKRYRFTKRNTARSSLNAYASATYRASGFEAHKPELLFGPPQLLSRRISVNPLETLASFLDLKFRDLDLLLALGVDRDRLLTIFVVVGNGVTSALVRFNRHWALRAPILTFLLK